MEKMTKKEMFTALMAKYADVFTADELGFLQHELDLVSRKGAKSGKLSKTQEANLVLMDKIVEAMEDGVQYSATEVGTLMDITCQKASSLLKSLVADGKVTKEIVKGASKFIKA